MLGNSPASEPLLFRRLTFDRGEIAQARFAPDGQTFVYSAAWRGLPSEIYTTRNDSRESRPLGFGHAALVAVSSAGELAISLDTDNFAFGGRHWPACRWPAALRTQASSTSVSRTGLRTEPTWPLCVS